MSTNSATTNQIPGYVAGAWDIDPIHSEVSFTVRHLMVSKVRGHFKTFEGQIVTGATIEGSSVTASIQLDSIDTRNEQRDDDLRSNNFFGTDVHPTMTYTSTQVRADGDKYVIDGDLTLHGVSKPVSLDLEINGFNADPWGNQRIGATATGQINRRDFGIDISMPMDGGGVVVGDKIQINIEVEAVLRKG